MAGRIARGEVRLPAGIAVVRLDVCTGEPPGELIASATALMLLMENARSSERATLAMVIPGRSGLEMPIAPARRTTGTIGRSERKRAGISGRSFARRRCIGVASGIRASSFGLPFYESFIVNTLRADFLEHQNRLGVTPLILEPGMKLLFLSVLMTAIVLAAHPGVLIRGSLARVMGRRAAA